MTFVTGTPANTVAVQGIGAVSGRMIYAVGDVALRGIENLVIRRRLRKVISAFPHSDDIGANDIETIYGYALELSRYLIAFVASIQYAFCGRGINYGPC